jgi:hypothetical protein
MTVSFTACHDPSSAGERRVGRFHRQRCGQWVSMGLGAPEGVVCRGGGAHEAVAESESLSPRVSHGNDPSLREGYSLVVKPVQSPGGRPDDASGGHALAGAPPRTFRPESCLSQPLGIGREWETTSCRLRPLGEQAQPFFSPCSCPFCSIEDRGSSRSTSAGPD